MTTCDLHNATILRLERELAQVKAERDGLRADAERYRWMRGQHFHFDLPPIAQCVWKQGSNPNGEWANLIDGDDLDKHIDAARQTGGDVPA
jgi:hypothetical protein